MTAPPSLLSRLTPPPSSGTHSTGAHSEQAGPGATSPTVQRTRTRGARNRNHPPQQSQSQLSSSPPAATQHDSAGPVPSTTRARAPPKATTSTAPRSIPAATTKSASDLATSRWAITPPPSPPLSKSPQTEFKPNSSSGTGNGGKSCSSSSPPSTSHDGGTSSEAIHAIDDMLARLRTLDVSPPSTKPTTNVETTALPPKPMTASAPSAPPKTTNTTAKQPALGGRSMWADDSDDDQHAQIPETYKALVVEAKKPTQLEPAVQISTAPKPIPTPTPTPVVSIPSSAPSPPLGKSPPPIVKLPSSPPAQVRKPPSRPWTPPPPSSNPSTSPPATPSSLINWADDDDQDGDLPELEGDWLIFATTTTTSTSTTGMDDLEMRASGLSISPTSAGLASSSSPTLESRFARRGPGGTAGAGGNGVGRGGAGSRTGPGPSRRPRGNDPTVLKGGPNSPLTATVRRGQGPPPPPSSNKSSDPSTLKGAISPSPRRLRSDRDPPPYAVVPHPIPMTKPTRGAPPPSSFTNKNNNPHPSPPVDLPKPTPRTRVAMNPSANLFGRLTGIKKDGATAGSTAGGTGTGAGVR